MSADWLKDSAVNNVAGLNDYVKRHKKKKKKEEDLAPVSDTPSWLKESAVENVARLDDDIAPVKTEKTEEKSGLFDGYFQKGAFEDGYQFGDIAKTLIATDADIATSLPAKVLDWGENALDAGAVGIAKLVNKFGNEGLRDKLTAFAEKDLYDGKDVARKILDSKFARRGGVLGALNAITSLDNMLNSEKVVNEDGEEVKVLQDHSVLDDKSDDLIGSAGETIVKMGISAATGLPVIADAVTGVTVFGAQAENALREGANIDQATGSALISAGAEIIGEKLSGGISFGGKTLDAGLTKLISENVSSVALRTILNGVADIGGESLEEVFTEFVDKLGTKLYKEESLGEILFSDEALQDYADAALAGGLLGGAFSGVNAVKSVADGTDYKTGLTDNENKVVNKEVENRIAEKEANGEKVTAKVKNEIYNEVMEDLTKGYISTDTIESVLDGKSYESYKNLRDNESRLNEKVESLTEEIDTLLDKENPTLLDKENPTIRDNERLAEARKELETAKSDLEKIGGYINEHITYTRHNMSEALKGERKGKGSYLAESYNEIDRLSQRYVADFSKYEGTKHADAARKTIENAMRRGANNTNRVHDIVEMGAKLSSDTGIVFDWAGNEDIKKDFIEQQKKEIAKLEAMTELSEEQSGTLAELKEMLRKVEAGEITVNGNITDNGVVINLDSKKALNRIVGHEIAHSLEKSAAYTELKEALFAYAKDKGFDVDAEIEAKTKTYKGVKKAQPEAELVADLVGDYIFNDYDFVLNLATNNRNVFQKVYDEVKYLYKLATAGSKEARDLARAKRNFEMAYRESANPSTKDSGKSAYSLSEAKTPTRKELESKKPIKVINVKEGLESGSYADMKTAAMNKATSEGWFDVPHHNIDTDSLIFLTEKSFTHAYSNLRSDFGEDTIRCMAHIPEIIQEAVLVSVDDPKNPRKAETKVYTFFGAIDGVNGLEPVKLTVKEFDFRTLEAVPQNIRAYFEKNGISEKYNSLYDAHALEVIGIEGIQKESDASGKVGEQGSRAQATSDSKISIADLLNLVKGDAEKYIPQYSLSDSDGKQLSKGQQEFFKNSKMRDENGNLKVMYHGSQDAGFHVFDAKMSDDDTSFFFVDRNDVAASYSGTSETYEAQTIRTAEDMNNFIKSIGAEGYEVIEEGGTFTLEHEGDYVASSDTAKGIYEEFCWYEGVGNGDANYKVYLNLTNPLVVDAEGRKWNKISREFSQEVYDKYQSLTAEEKEALTQLASWGEISIFRDEINDAFSSVENGKIGALDDPYIKNLAAAHYKLDGANVYDMFTIASENFSEESLREFAVKQMNTRDYAKRAKEQGYDGVIFNNIHDNGGYSNGSEGASTVAIAFSSEQIKSVANAEPTSDPDIRYSLSEDSEGRKLSTQQQNFFKDSKIRNDNGSLKVMHHGSPETFSVFDKSKAKSSGTYGKGFYFTDSTSHASTYGKTYDIYLNITNPLQDGTNDITKEQIRKFVEAIAENEDYGIDNYGYDATIDSVTNSVYGKSDFAMILDLNISCVGNMVEAIELFNKVNGTDYNGIVAPLETVAFYPEQIKSIDNKAPTDNPDINMSLSEEGEQLAPLGRHEMLGSDFRVRGDNVLAPVQEAGAENATTTERAPVAANVTPDGFAPIPESEANAMQSENIATLNDSDAPSEIAPYYGEEAQESATPSNPFEQRDYTKVGNPKAQAYTEENPEVKPFFQEAAQGMLGDLQNTLKGERWYNDALYSESGGEQGFSGTRRDTTADIADLLDGQYHYTYQQIEDALNAIINDGKLNACAKRIEFALNDRLLNGYTDINGNQIPPNQDYINMLGQMRTAEDIHRAGVESIEHIIEAPLPQAEAEAVAKPTIEAPLPDVSNAGKNVAQGKKSMQQEKRRVAQVLTEEPQKPKKKSRLWSIIRTNALDKQSVFEDLALKTKNRELMGKANYMLSSESRAQWFIGHGRGRVKALTDIKNEVESSGKLKDFHDYIYHVHNIDRMSLESDEHKAQRMAVRRQFKGLSDKQIEGIAKTWITKDTTAEEEAKIRAAREYVELSKNKDKPVFDYSITADISREEVKKYEAMNPEFKAWAQDVYDYNKYLRKMLVDGNVISQETADLWEKIYPHFVPIRRDGQDGSAVNVPLDSRKTGVNAPIKRATGGNADILPLFDTMALRTEQTFKAVAKNQFGLELLHTLDSAIEADEANGSAASVDDVLEGMETQDELLQKGKDGMSPTFTVFENGKRVTFEITEDMYDALKPTGEALKYTNKVLNTANNIRRGLITEYNPVFLATNAIKDVQDILINSQHAAKTYAKIPQAYWELAKKGKWYTEYMAAGGEQNTFFDGESKTFKKEDEGFKKLIGMPLRAISAANNFMERAPRLAEYIASRESGASIETAMLDAARVTTNFAAGGDVTKALNRNGFTFLNASVQGAMQQVRNIREAKQNGFKGWAQLAAKTMIAGIPALLLNGLLWDDDEDYEELSDYVKDNYYIVAKYGDGQFVRIPKGRAVAVIQDAFEQIGNALTGNDEVDLGNFLNLVTTNLAPTNPADSNILAPIKQVLKNETWYGEDLVPTRLQDLPAEEQFDESTDSISKWLGEVTNTSPIKWNYLLDQYSGAVGDVFLPMMTPEAESGNDTFVGNMLAPWKDKFSTDSVMNNQNVSDFYDKVDELAKNANGSRATDEDILMSKYMNSVSSELGELYGLKREIQNSDLSDSRKYEKVRDIQDEINALARESLDTYANVQVDGNYATVGDLHYQFKNGKWQKLSDDQYDKQIDVTEDLGISASDYWSNKSEYDFAHENPERYAVARSVGGYESYKTYMSSLYDIKADKDESGKSIRGSRKEKVIAWVNEQEDLDYGEAIILFKSEYPADDTYNYDIIDYLNGRDDISYEDMETILKELGFNVDSEGNITWD